jgi:hypothetical protein
VIGDEPVKFIAAYEAAVGTPASSASLAAGDSRPRNAATAPAATTAPAVAPLMGRTYWGMTDEPLPAAVGAGCEEVGCGPLDGSPSHARIIEPELPGEANE